MEKPLSEAVAIDEVNGVAHFGQEPDENGMKRYEVVVAVSSSADLIEAVLSAYVLAGWSHRITIESPEDEWSHMYFEIKAVERPKPIIKFFGSDFG